MKTFSRTLVAILAVALLAGCQAPKEAADLSAALAADAIADLRVRSSESAAKDQYIMQLKADKAFAEKAEKYEQTLFMGALEAVDSQAAAMAAAEDTVAYLRELNELNASLLAETDRLNGTSRGIEMDVDALLHVAAMKKAEAGVAAKSLQDFAKSGVVEVVLTAINESQLLNSSDLVLSEQQRAEKAVLVAKRAAEAKKAGK